MKSEGLIKPALVVFIVALVVYIIAYSAIEHRRMRNGPWQVAFTNDASGAPALLINQTNLAITNVLIAFPGESSPPFTNATPLDFAQPRPVPFDVPFGKCLFMDTTFLPGTIVFELYGHEIQLIPRTLTIDRREQSWRSDAKLAVEPAQLPAPDGAAVPSRKPLAN